MSIGGSPGFGCDDVGSEQKICDCLGCSLESIAKTHKEIKDILDERLGKICDNVDECADEIIQAINDRIGSGLRSSEECQLMLQRGLGGTLEYAMKCAWRPPEPETVVCSLGDPSTEGKRCITPEGKPGVCRNGVCVALEPEEERKRKFVGWCNPATRVVVVTTEGEGSPGPGFGQVAIAETEQVAFLEAQSVCEALPRPEITPRPEPLPHGVVGHDPQCNLESLVNGNTLTVASQSIQQFNASGGQLQIARSLSDLGGFGVTVGSINDLISGIYRLFAQAPSRWADFAAKNFAPVVGCTDPGFQAALQLLLNAQIFERQAGTDFSEFLLPYRYAAHAACRQTHLSPREGLASYMANRITRDQLEQLWAIHGICHKDVEWAIAAERSKPVFLQLATMRHREIISQSEYHNLMREIGFLDRPIAERMFETTRVLPTLTDIIRFMVRDADDEQGVVRQFGLDAEFTKKFRPGGQLEKWTKQQGIPELVAKYAWRAHWSIPSPSQLFEFYHRLRKNPKFGGEAKLLQDIKDALTQQDILPFWHEHYLAVSFRPMRLRDIRRSFQVGTLTEQEAKDNLSQLGYADPTVDLMFRFLERLRDNAAKNHRVIKQWVKFQISRQDANEVLRQEGIPQNTIDRAFDEASPGFITSEPAKAFVRGDLTQDQLALMLNETGVRLDIINRMVNLLALRKTKSEAVDDYSAGIIDDGTAVSQMISEGFDTRVARNIIDRETREQNRQFVVTCQRGIKRRFLTGEIDIAQATAELTNRGTDSQYASRLVDWWQCELKSGEKHVSANTLCEWLARGAISSVDFTDRLKRIGYSADDAARMLDDCLIKVSAKRLAQAKKEAKEHAIEQNRIARILERQARDEARLLKQQQSAQETARKTRARRDKQLYSATDKLTDKCECELADAINVVKSEQRRIRDNYVLTIDQSLQVLLLAAEEFPKGGTLADFPPIVDTVAQATATAEYNEQTTPSTNGQQQG